MTSAGAIGPSFPFWWSARSPTTRRSQARAPWRESWLTGRSRYRSSTSRSRPVRVRTGRASSFRRMDILRWRVTSISPERLRRDCERRWWVTPSISAKNNLQPGWLIGFVRIDAQLAELCGQTISPFPLGFALFDQLKVGLEGFAVGAVEFRSPEERSNRTFRSGLKVTVGQTDRSGRAAGIQKFGGLFQAG